MTTSPPLPYLMCRRLTYNQAIVHVCTSLCSYKSIVFQEKLDDEYHEKMIEHEKAAEIRTAKKRNKRWVVEISDLPKFKAYSIFNMKISVMDVV